MLWCKMSRGLFITFEGIDGCGKSTQLKNASSYLESKSVSHIVTREPGGTPVSEKIRELILSTQNSEMKDSCELLLYLSARAQHVEEKIKPALTTGHIVLCDRFQEATFAYQGFGRQYPLELLEQLNTFATNGLVPDLTFIFDINVDCAFERMHKINKTPDRVESNSKEFFTRIREGYLALASTHPHRIKLLQGEKTINELSHSVQEEISSLIEMQLE